MPPRAKAKTRTVSWTNRHDELAKKVVARHADKMRMNDIMPYTNTTHEGERAENVSGAILYALMLAAGEIDTESDE